jgi:hypothetical protein
MLGFLGPKVAAGEGEGFQEGETVLRAGRDHEAAAPGSRLANRLNVASPVISLRR